MVLDSPEGIHWGFLLIFCLFFQNLGFGELVHASFCHFQNWIRKRGDWENSWTCFSTQVFSIIYSIVWRSISMLNLSCNCSKITIDSMSSLLHSTRVCTNTWYGNGFDKKCPKCNTPRGLSKTFILKGFDNLVHQLELMNEETLSNDSNDTLPLIRRIDILFIFLVLRFRFANDNNFFKLFILYFFEKVFIFTDLTDPSITCSKLTQKIQLFILF